nr:Hsp20 family protein [Streptomyces sp. NBC_00120]
MLLPEEVNTEGVNAQISDGVLTVTVSKTEAAKPVTSGSPKARAVVETSGPASATVRVAHGLTDSAPPQAAG